MNVYKNILVAVDASSGAETAFNRAVAVALRNEASLMLAHVIESSVNIPREYSGGLRTQSIEKSEAWADQLLNDFKIRAIESGVKDVRTRIAMGNPKVEIIKGIAPFNSTDLIICGATGTNTLQRIFIGSVSEYISRNAVCDVLIVRE
ncbi:universal stress protein [Fictibacillus iocasae]|uniref:Universal stress protein n=1 Tax=Fictibacillus iocasae TaxID=2715437 RepID=A0ABW2NZ81_9BACL